MQKLRWAALTLMIFMCFCAYADTLYVKTDGDDANPGDSWENAKATIQAGIYYSPKDLS